MFELLKEDEAAKLLKVSPKTLTRWRWEGKGPVYCKLGVGGAVRYRLEDLLAFIELMVISHD